MSETDWSILGEQGKLVLVSAQRLVSFSTIAGSTVDETAVSMVLMGSPGELVPMLVAFRSTVHQGSCAMPRSGRVTMQVRERSNDVLRDLRPSK